MRIRETLSRPVFNLSLPAWQRMRASHRDIHLPRLLEFRFAAAGRMLSSLQRLQDQLFRKTLREVEIRRPILILGHWRSGTTLLHELLALDDHLVSPTTFQCFNPQRFLLTGAVRVEAARRPTGDIMVANASPQEDEFALLCLGAVSPYEAFLFPDALKKLEALCDPGIFAADEAQLWSDLWLGFLRGVLHARGKEKRLLLKSPSHSMRVPTIVKLFPDAVFIVLTRDADSVFASTVRMWETMWRHYAIANPLRRTELERCVSRIQEAVAEKLHLAADQIPADRFVTISYEDLTADPLGTIAALYRILDLEGPSSLAVQHAHYLAEADAVRSEISVQ